MLHSHWCAVFLWFDWAKVCATFHPKKISVFFFIIIFFHWFFFNNPYAVSGINATGSLKPCHRCELLGSIWRVIDSTCIWYSVWGTWTIKIYKLSWNDDSGLLSYLNITIFHFYLYLSRIQINQIYNHIESVPSIKSCWPKLHQWFQSV